jgi:hypothetical protein
VEGGADVVESREALACGLVAVEASTDLDHDRDDAVVPVQELGGYDGAAEGRVARNSETFGGEGALEALGQERVRVELVGAEADVRTIGGLVRLAWQGCGAERVAVQKDALAGQSRSCGARSRSALRGRGRRAR